MSKMYVVKIEETLVKCVVVEAENASEAENIAVKAYGEEEVVFGSDDYLDTEFCVLRVADEIDIDEYQEVYVD